jgi:hypothetical protein
LSEVATGVAPRPEEQGVGALSVAQDVGEQVVAGAYDGQRAGGQLGLGAAQEHALGPGLDVAAVGPVGLPIVLASVLNASSPLAWTRP